MFSKEYLANLSARTGFEPRILQRQMILLELLREIHAHTLLGKKFALKGGTAINLFWLPLPRLSVDIDLNYIASVDREMMLKDRPNVEHDLKRLMQSRGFTVDHAPTDHAGAKWRLRAKSALGGHFKFEVDLNYILRVPIWGIQAREVYPLDDDYVFTFNTVSVEKLFAGKIAALLDRAAARDLFDVAELAENSLRYDRNKLRQALILFGITSDSDWRKKDLSTIDGIDQHQLNQELSALLREGDAVDLATMQQRAKDFLSELLHYDDKERLFMDRFIEQGEYEPELLFDDPGQARRLKHHPAVLWKLQNHRKYLGIEKQIL